MATSSFDYSLELLLSSPLFWKSRKVCVFLIQCHEHIHEKSDNQTKEFIDTLNKLALEYKVWPPGETWKDSIDQHDKSTLKEDEGDPNVNNNNQGEKALLHFNVLTTYTKKDGTTRNKPIPVDTNKFTDLLGVIRNKFAHRFLLNDTLKHLLRWFKEDPTNNWTFELQLFADYWINRFPLLLLFMWEQYKNLDDFSNQNLADVYPQPLRKYYSSNLFFGLEDFQLKLFKVLGHHLLEEGCIETRFSLEGSDNHVLLEFRTLNKNLVDAILDRSFSVEITVTESDVTCEWLDLIDGQLSFIDKRSTPIICHEGLIDSEERFIGNIIICNKISDIVNFANAYFKKLAIDTTSKIIIFTRADFTNLFYFTEFYESSRSNLISYVINNFKFSCPQIPITFGDTGKELQKLVVQEQQILPFGKRLFQMSPNEDIVWDYVLSNLDQDMLSAIIKNTGPNFLSMPEVPSIVNKYISKRFHRENLFTFDIIDNLIENEIICVISNANEECLEQFSKKSLQNFIHITDVNNIFPLDEIINSKIFIIKEDVKDFRNLYLSLKRINSSVNIQCFRYLCLGKLEWIKAECSRVSTNESISKLLTESVRVGEIELLNLVEKTNEKRIIIVGEGGGNSQTLISIANKIKKQKPDRFVINLPVIDFLVLADKNGLTIDAILTAFTSVLSKTKIEKKLIENWLRFRKIVLFEIMVDGLETLNANARSKFLLIMDTLNRNFLSVRFWVSSSEYVVDHLKGDFPALWVNIDSLSEHETISLLSDNWVTNNGIKDKLRCDVVREYATKCYKHLHSAQKAPIDMSFCNLISRHFPIDLLVTTDCIYELDLRALLYLHDKHPCLFDMLCDISEMNGMRKNKYIDTFNALKDHLDYSNPFSSRQNLHLHIAVTSLWFLIPSLWFRNYKLCEFIIKTYIFPKALPDLQKLNGMGYGVLHIVILSLTYALPDQDVPELAEIQAFLQFVVEIDPSVLEQRDCKGQTPLLLLLREADSLVIDCKSLLQFFIADLKANINVWDEDNKTALYFKMRNEENSMSSQPERETYFRRILDRSTLLDLYVSLWEILYENGPDMKMFCSDLFTKISFSDVEILGISFKHGLCFYKIRGPENVDVFLSKNFRT